MFVKFIYPKSAGVLPAAGAAALLAASLGLGTAAQTAQASLISFGSDASVTSSSPSNGGVYSVDNGTMTLNAGGNAASNTRPLISGNVLKMTTQNGGEATSAWFNTKQDISDPWTAKFTWDGDGGADGFYFALQNTDAGLHYLGASGGAKGFTDSNNNAPANGFGVGVELWGGKTHQIQIAYPDVHAHIEQVPTDADPSVIDFNGTQTSNFTLSYDGNTYLTIKAVQGDHTIESTLDLGDTMSNIVGGDTAYIGFTGGTGGVTMKQKFSNFYFGPPQTWIPGDANMDGKVDGLDLQLIANNWQGTGDTWNQGDFNGDGKVDGLDLQLLANNWQAGVSGSAAQSFAQAAAQYSFGSPVPEPASLALMGLGGLLLARRRRSA